MVPSLDTIVKSVLPVPRIESIILDFSIRSLVSILVMLATLEGRNK
jgi:hypothetical protein